MREAAHELRRVLERSAAAGPGPKAELALSSSFMSHRPAQERFQRGRRPCTVSQPTRLPAPDPSTCHEGCVVRMPSGAMSPSWHES